MATILDCVVGSCVKKLQNIITEEAILILGVKEDLKELQRTMRHIQCFLNDAEQRRTEESAVNNWLGELKDAMYEADDIIDLARLEGNKLLADNASSSRRPVKCTGFQHFSCLPSIRRRHNIAIRIRKFNTELEKVSKLGERFLKHQNIPPKGEDLGARRIQTCDLVEPYLVGKETMLACTRLVELILEDKKKKTYMIGIVGTGGVGKTTLAQQIYNHHKINGTFSIQVWICVSQEYSKVALLKEILRKIGVDYKQEETVGELTRKLAITVENKSLFLVLDDIWEQEVWFNLLRTPLDKTSKIVILVTTRNDIVTRAIGTDVVHRVELMTDDTGWELIWKSMNISEEAEVQNLSGIGKEIVRMCGGLPLAIKVIARVLATKERNEIQWRQVMNKSAWSFSKIPTELRGALYLSYDDLPRHLKQCFIYCALYPEDYRMHRDDLIRYWVAEGFVQEEEEQLLEDSAFEYYNELIFRNLLHPDPNYLDNAWCKMHDLLRLLGQHLSQNEYFCGLPQSLEAKSLSKLRHISIIGDKDSITLPNVNGEHITARTLHIHCTKPTRMENEIFQRLPYIRVLDLTYSIIKNVPDCIGTLIHLRLLDLDGTDISYLPESICSLKYLQVLNLQWCLNLRSLPMAITKLCNLRRIGLDRTPLNQVPKGISELKSLNDLEGFPIGGSSVNSARLMQDGWNLEELGPLMQLRRLDMSKLERASCSNDSLLINKRYLKDLHLMCTARTDEPYSEDDVNNIEKTFELLIPAPNLEDLGFVNFFGQRFPTWLQVHNHLSQLKYLRLIDCKSCFHLPPIGHLPNLKYVKITGATSVTRVGPEFIGLRVNNPSNLVAFPKLEILVIRDMANWEEWIFVDEEEQEAIIGYREEGEDGAARMQNVEAQTQWIQLLPHLKKLELTQCPKLRALPQQLRQEATSLMELQLRFLDSIKVVENFPFLCDTLVISKCEGIERVTNIPLVRVLRAQVCPNLRCVEGLDNLHQLFLTEDMQDPSSHWLPRLQEQHLQLHGDDLDFFIW